MDEAELLRRLDRVAGLQPPPESTERAMVRVRSALTTAPTPNRKLRMITRFGALAAAVAATLALGWWLFSPSAGNLAFADVQEKVKQTKTVTVLYTLDPGKGPAVVIKAIFLADGRARLEDPTGGGGYTTIDPKRERSLTVDPAAKQATLIRGYHHPGPTDIYRTMREIRNDEVQRFPPENVDGRTAEVFLAKLKGTDDFHPVPDEYKVYVDAATKLPFRLEGSLPGQNGEPGTRVRFELEFDQPLEEKLFSTEPPPGYTARTEGIDLPHKPTADPDKIAPTVTRDGIGPVNFGMTKKEVIEKLGEPDKIDQRGTALDYLSRGYSLLVSPQRGVMMIQCYTQATFVVKVKDFTGRTSEGIRMGATSADIIKAYGEPEAKEKQELTTRLSYPNLGLEFTLFSDKLVQYSVSPAIVAPVVKAKEGLGPVKFGMAIQEVLDKLGRPDNIDQHGSVELDVDGHGATLEYLSRGYGIEIGHRQLGVVVIKCYTRWSLPFAPNVKDFAGRTHEGIAMGATSAEIIKAYGEPDAKREILGAIDFSYRKLGLELTLLNDKLVQFSLSPVQRH